MGIRNGKPNRGGREVQRFRCGLHGYYYDPDLVNEREQEIRSKVNDYLFSGGSQRSRAGEVGRSRRTLGRRLKKLRFSCMNDLEIAEEFKPNWGNGQPDDGVIVIDATGLDGSPYVMYVAFDQKTGDLVCCMLARAEDEQSWLKLLRRLDSTAYRIKLIVSDKGPGNCIMLAVRRHYPGIPHQLDWEHEMREIEEILPPVPRDDDAANRRRKPWQNEKELLLYRLVWKMRRAANEEEFEKVRKRILRLYASTTNRGREVIKLLEKDHVWLKARYKANSDVATSNAAEYGIGRFKVLFLKRMKGIHCIDLQSAEKAMNLLWAAYRVKPMDDSTDPQKKGRCTLQLAHANVQINDIWQFDKKEPPKLGLEV